MAQKLKALGEGLIIQIQRGRYCGTYKLFNKERGST